MEDYLDAADLWNQPQTPLFQAANTRKQLTGSRLHRTDVVPDYQASSPGRWLCRRPPAATPSGPPPSPPTYSMVVRWKTARQMVAHQSSQTTRLYDRRADQVTLDEIERIRI